jgi:hypothetical protein
MDYIALAAAEPRHYFGPFRRMGERFHQFLALLSPQQCDESER